MPFPVVLGAVAAVAGIAGVGAGVDGGIKVKRANDRESRAKELHDNNLARFERAANNSEAATESLGRVELETLESFERFSTLTSKVQNAPHFDAIKIDGIELPSFDPESLRRVSISAKSLLSGITGATAGALSGVAASGATTAIVAAIGTASTGTAISTLSGAAAVNATLAALGGGSLAAGGGGMALGTAVLSGTAAGAGILVAGVVVNIVSRKLSSDVDELCQQVEQERINVNEACILLNEIRVAADDYRELILDVQSEYLSRVAHLERVVGDSQKFCWDSFSEEEKLLFENVVLLTGVLYKMCQLNLIVDIDGDGAADRVNSDGLEKIAALVESSVPPLHSVQN
ncbi:hypothetical protein [uncultured Adlercreutzia sp.]|uniref:hypothetical protein n=1 Tax=uncultured Adlercreutzia sp. TaxID=875803 RepID=UPI0026F3CF52|nr:hypothetical protein [uncultured Adlercreutzia sp.]